MRTLLVAILLTSGACGSRPPPPPTGPALGTSHDTTHRAPPPVVREPAAATSVVGRPSPEARNLLAATRALDTTEPRLDHERVVRALRALADVLAIVAPDQGPETARVRDAVARLAGSDPHAVTHSAFVRTALDSATTALTRMLPSPRADLARYQGALAELRNDTVKVSTDRPLLDQYTEVRAALRAATRAVFAADGVEQPTFAATSPTASR